MINSKLISFEKKTCQINPKISRLGWGETCQTLDDLAWSVSKFAVLGICAVCYAFGLTQDGHSAVPSVMPIACNIDEPHMPHT